jgi:polynucleotide 5'-hydroxyl-kinase GRC3/NOL9
MDVDGTNLSPITGDIPLVVNTMGWSKGLGVDLTQKIAQLVAPSTVFALEPTRVSDTPYASYEPPVPAHEDPGPPPRILDAIAPPLHAPRQTASDHRALALLSYFYAVFPPDARPGTVVQSWDTRRPLCAVPPYALDLPRAMRSVVIAGAGAEDVVPVEAARVLNGALVAFVRDDDDDATIYAAEEDWGLPYVQGAPPPDPSSSSCVGLALVRALSPAARELQLLTPCPTPGARTIVKGELEIPIWGMLDHTALALDEVPGADAGVAPFLQWGRAQNEGVLGGEKRRVRRNLMRKGQR